MQGITAVLMCAAAPGFLRGMGWSPWHAKYGWGRPPAVVAQDFAILKDLRVNALRTWGPVRPKALEEYGRHGLWMVPQIRRGKTPKMRFKDGKPGHTAYVALESLADIRRHARALAESLRGRAWLAAYNLGNEYSWVGRNKSGSWQSQGFDAATQKAFHDALRRRFGSIERWRRLTRRSDRSFDAIVPPTGTARGLLYWEWWRFQREAFSAFLRAGYEAIKEVDPRTPVTYALLCGGRWDAATEDADLSFLDWQGDNLYYHWDKNWCGFCVRLARRIGPGRPILITESGVNTWRIPDARAAARLMKQMLWILALHPEVKGVFPFVYCDEWWHGPDPKSLDVAGDAWGILTADRKPKCTYAPLRDTYVVFERRNAFMSTRRAPVQLLVTDQVIDRLRGRASPSAKKVCRALYRHGVSFRLVSLLRPQDLSDARCRRLLMLDSTIPDEPDGSSPARAALAEFERRGGRILYLCDRPWRGMYLPDGPPANVRAEVAAAKKDLWPMIQAFLGERLLRVDARGGEVFWRRLSSSVGDFLLLVSTDAAPPKEVRIHNAPAATLVSSDGAKVVQEGNAIRLPGFDTYALLRVSPGGR